MRGVLPLKLRTKLQMHCASASISLISPFFSLRFVCIEHQRVLTEIEGKDLRQTSGG